jgi:hypothetical protein
MRCRFIASSLLILLCSSSVARAEGLRAEFSMGFMAGQRDYSGQSFVLQRGDEAGLLAPFESAPFDALDVFGLRYDLRLIVSYLRMTVGVDFPFAHYAARDTEASFDGRTVSVREIRPYELRFGIGGEYPTKSVTPFVDLMGVASWCHADLSIDGQSAEYLATAFGFSLRGGARVNLRRWLFLVASGEVGLVGNTFWNAELSVGFALD